MAKGIFYSQKAEETGKLCENTGLSEWRIFCCLSMNIRLSLQVFGSPAIL